MSTPANRLSYSTGPRNRSHGALPRPVYNSATADSRGVPDQTRSLTRSLQRRGMTAQGPGPVVLRLGGHGGQGFKVDVNRR